MRSSLDLETWREPHSSVPSASSEARTFSTISPLTSRLLAYIVRLLLLPLRLSMATWYAMDAVLDYPCPWYEKLFVLTIFVLSAPVCSIWYYVAFRDSIES